MIRTSFTEVDCNSLRVGLGHGGARGCSHGSSPRFAGAQRGSCVRTEVLPPGLLAPAGAKESAHRWNPFHLLLAAAIIPSVLCAPARAQLVFEGALLESSGRVERAGITSLRIGTSGVSELSETGPRGFVRTRAPGEILALVPGWWADAFPGSASGLAASAPRDGAPEPFIELVDGQRFVGHPGRIGSEGEAIAWVHEKFGTLMLPIDEVARFVLRPLPGDTLSLPGTPSADTLWLINGDRLEGFVETVGSRAGGELSLIHI